MGHFKLETIVNVDKEIVNSLLDLVRLWYHGRKKYQTASSFAASWEVSLSKYLMVTLEFVLHRDMTMNIYYVLYIQGSKVPPLFELKNVGLLISFGTVPLDLNLRIRGWTLCCVLTFQQYICNNPSCTNPGYLLGNSEIYVVNSNETKSRTWQHSLKVIGLPGQDEYMMFR